MKHFILLAALGTLSACGGADRSFGTQESCPEVSPYLTGSERFPVRCVPQEGGIVETHSGDMTMGDDMMSDDMAG